MNKALATEAINATYSQLDTWETPQILTALIDDQHQAIAAVQKALPQITQAVDQALGRMQQGGRLIYVGAGTSGRLGQLDASELPPTFSWPRHRAVACIAGGQGALTTAIEGAEDDLEAGKNDLLALNPTPNDVVLAIAASGTTPYPQGALLAAKEVGALSIGLANNPSAPLLELCDCAILLETGPEVISGSTRLKAGTAQKIALNAFSSALMVRLGKVYGNLMVDVQATNAKLVKRAIRLTSIATQAPETQTLHALQQCNFEVKTAIVMIKKALNVEAARELLQAHGGNVRRALG